MARNALFSIVPLMSTLVAASARRAASASDATSYNKDRLHYDLIDGNE